MLQTRKNYRLVFTTETPFEHGKRMFNEGKKFYVSSPFIKGSEQHKAWCRGWVAAEKEKEATEKLAPEVVVC